MLSLFVIVCYYSQTIFEICVYHNKYPNHLTLNTSWLAKYTTYFTLGIKFCMILAFVPVWRSVIRIRTRTNSQFFGAVDALTLRNTRTEFTTNNGCLRSLVPLERCDTLRLDLEYIYIPLEYVAYFAKQDVPSVKWLKYVLRYKFVSFQFCL